MFHPIYSDYRNTIANANAIEAKSDASAARNEVEGLKSDIERLLMISEALWTVLKEQHGYDDNELIKRIATIDMRDGKLDGKVAPQPPQPCPKCGRTLFKKRQTCLYCGEFVAVNPFQR